MRLHVIPDPQHRVDASDDHLSGSYSAKQHLQENHTGQIRDQEKYVRRDVGLDRPQVITFPHPLTLVSIKAILHETVPVRSVTNQNYRMYLNNLESEE